MRPVKQGQNGTPVHVSGQRIPNHGLLPQRPANFSSAVPSAQTQQSSLGDLQGLTLSPPSYVPVQNASFSQTPFQTYAPSAGGPRFPPSATGFPRTELEEANGSVEERKRLEHQRQQMKVRQSFETSRNKVSNSDVLMGKIIADFDTVTVKKSALQSTNQRTVQSRPATPHDSPTLSLHRDRSGSLNISPQTSARLREPTSDPPRNVSLSKPSTENSIKTPDLGDLMMKFSDLSTSATPTKKNFTVAPKAVTSSVTSAVTSAVTSVPSAAFYTNSQSAVDWNSISSDLTSAFTNAQTTPGHSATAAGQFDLPPWCFDMTSLPHVYQSVMQLFKNQSFIPKSSVFGVMTRSGLGKASLEQIWTVTCRTREDSLTRNELCAALGLIGLAQTSFDVQHLTIDVLRRIPNPPEPFFIASPPAQTTQAPIHTTPTAPGWPSTPTGAAWPSLPVSPLEFQNIPLTQPSLSSVPLGLEQKEEEEEFADFVSAPTQTVPVKPYVRQPEVAPPLQPVLPQQLAPPALPAVRQNSLEDPGWGDWAQPTLPAKISEPVVAKKQPAQSAFRPEMIGRSETGPTGHKPAAPQPAVNRPIVLKPAGVNSPAGVSLPPFSAPILPVVEDVPEDPYAALRDLAPAVSDPVMSDLSLEQLPDQLPVLVQEQRKGNGFSLKHCQFSDGSLSATVESPHTGMASGDDLSVNSLDFGSVSAALSGDLGTISFESLSGPSLVLDKLELTGEAVSSQPGVGGTEVEVEVEVEVGVEHRDVWIRALQTCSVLLEETCTVFNSVNDSTTLMKVIAKAENHIQDLVEVYRVARRLYIGARSVGLMDDEGIVDAIKDTEEAWADFMTFLNMAAMEPQSGSMDFSRGDISGQMPGVSAICGVCLLDVDVKSKGQKGKMDSVKVECEGRFYHTVCANFWLNCVTDKLPRLLYKNVI